MLELLAGAEDSTLALINWLLVPLVLPVTGVSRTETLANGSSTVLGVPVTPLTGNKLLEPSGLATEYIA